MTGTGIQITGFRDFFNPDLYNEFNIRLTKTQYIYIKQVVNNELEIISCLNDIIEKI